MPYFMKICPLGIELFHADRRTDMAKRIVAFHHFAKAPETACTSKISELFSYDYN